MLQFVVIFLAARRELECGSAPPSDQPCLALLMGELDQPLWGGISCAGLLALKHANERNGAVVPEFATLMSGTNLSAAVYDTGRSTIEAIRNLEAEGDAPGTRVDILPVTAETAQLWAAQALA